MNNRQNGRRRGRGGPQVRGPGNGQERGNRIDNRARGNAAQLLEKYKNLARDAQMQGDRVMTEYYHQFADHYFRVLSESRSRFEEQQGQGRRDPRDDDDFYGDDGFDEGDRPEPPQRAERQPRQDQPRYEQRGEQQRGEQQRGDQPRYERSEQPRQERAEREDRPRFQRPPRDEQPEPAVEAQPAPPPAAAAQPDGDDAEARRPRRRRRRAEDDAADGPRIEVDRLPPAFADREAAPAPAPAPVAADGEEPAAEEAPKRRRTRRTPKDGDSVAA